MGLFDGWLSPKPAVNPFKPKPIRWAKTPLLKGKGKLFSESSFYRNIFGEPHPIDLKTIEEMYKRVPIIFAAINKTIDSITGSDFKIKSNDPQVEIECEQFCKDKKFDIVLRDIVKNIILFGNSYIEIVGGFTDIKILNPIVMFVRRDPYGEVLEYTQVVPGGQPIRWNLNDEEETNQIAHFKYNVLGDCAYGYPIIAPMKDICESKLQMEKIMVDLMRRKANVPFHFKLGDEDSPARDEDIQSFAADLQHITATTEWVTSKNVEINAIDIASKLPKFDEINNHIENQIVYGTEVPIVLLGKGNINEGLATVQLEAYSRRINSIRLDLEAGFEDKIFRPYLENLGYSDFELEFEWEPQTKSDKWREIEKIQILLMSNTITLPSMKKALYERLARLLEVDVEVGELEEMSTNEFANQNPFQQMYSNPINSNPFKQTSPFDKNIFDKSEPKVHQKTKEPKELPFTASLKKNIIETINEDFSITEWTGRNPNPIMDKILKYLKRATFSDMDANESQKNSIRSILMNGFEKGNTINQLRDRIEPVVKDKNRATMIARTESVRATNEAYLDDLEEAGVKSVRWVTIEDNRTCEICSPLNGQVMSIEKARERMVPHVNCRCTFAGIFN